MSSNSSPSSPNPSPSSSSSINTAHSTSSMSVTHDSGKPTTASTVSSITLPPPQPGLLDAVRTIKPADLRHIHEKPCARESLLTGMGAGFGVGGLRFILMSGPLRIRQWPAMSWAVGAFVVTSAGAHAFCQRRRTLERNAMLRASEIMEEKKKSKIREAEERKRVKEEEKGKGVAGWVGWK